MDCHSSAGGNLGQYEKIWIPDFAGMTRKKMLQSLKVDKEIKKEIPEVKFLLKRRQRSRSIRISVYQDGRCVVSAPSFLAENKIAKFVKTKLDWIVEKLKGFMPFKPIVKRKNSRVEFKKYKNTAHSLAKERLSAFNKNYGFKIGKVTIRNQKSRWGSCSAKGNLNFNYKLVLLPKELSDYIIVHELCHLGQMNHSIKFWNLVAKVFPNFRDLRHELKKEGMNLG